MPSLRNHNNAANEIALLYMKEIVHVLKEIGCLNWLVCWT